MSDMRDERATVEVGGKVYSLARAKMPDTRVTYSDRLGRTAVVQAQPPWIEGSMQGDEARDFYFSNPPEYRRCQVVFGGTTYAGRMLTLSWRNNPSMVDVQIDCLEPVPAAPTLDELTDPADLDWGTIRSTCAARDWRAAWGVVGTDHTGDATPGEVYLLAVARRASATAAALHHWRQAEMESGTIFVGADAARAWQRIKNIAAWESSARAQYIKRPPSAKQKRMEWLNERIRPGAFQLPDDILGGRYSTVNVGDLVIDDPVGSFEEVLWHAMADSATQARLYGRDNVSDAATLDALRQQAAVIDDPVEPDPELYGNGRGVVGVLNNPFLSAAAQRGEITGTMTFRHDGDQLMARYGVTAEAPITITASNENAADFMARGGVVGAVALPPGSLMDAMRRDAQRTANPAPRGPQTRKRR